MNIDEWVIREVIDTLHQANITLLKITALDSPREIAKKCVENETAITRRIWNAIGLLKIISKGKIVMSKNKELMNSSVDLRTHHTRGKKCKLVIRVCMTKKILVEEEYESIASAKRAFREKYYPNYHIYNAEYAIIRDGKKEKFRLF